MIYSIVKNIANYENHHWHSQVLQEHDLCNLRKSALHKTLNPCNPPCHPWIRMPHFPLPWQETLHPLKCSCLNASRSY